MNNSTIDRICITKDKNCRYSFELFAKNNILSIASSINKYETLEDTEEDIKILKLTSQALKDNITYNYYSVDETTNDFEWGWKFDLRSVRREYLFELDYIESDSIMSSSKAYPEEEIAYNESIDAMLVFSNAQIIY